MVDNFHSSCAVYSMSVVASRLDWTTHMDDTRATLQCCGHAPPHHYCFEMKMYCLGIMSVLLTFTLSFAKLMLRHWFKMPIVYYSEICIGVPPDHQCRWSVDTQEHPAKIRNDEDFCQICMAVTSNKWDAVYLGQHLALLYRLDPDRYIHKSY